MIELKHVSFSYGEGLKDTGIFDISINIKKGETILLCGESGCGKTTLTRLLNGLIPNYYEGSLSGDVLVNGKNVSTAPLYETAEMVGSVFQNPRSQFFNVDTTSELAFACENMGLEVEEIEKRITKTVDEFQMQSLMNRSLFELSGGEKQKIACASVSIHDPDVYVLDEPSSNLDTVAIENLRQTLEVWKRMGKTIIISEHRLYYLRELADRVLYIKDGKITDEYAMADILKISTEKLSEMGLRPLYLENLKHDAKIVDSNQQLNLTEFSFCYKNKLQALNIPTLAIPIGSITAIIGHNGAGKSTFAKCLCGLEKRFKGKLEIAGKRYESKNFLKLCYMVMQDVNHQLFTESVLEEVLLSMKKSDEEKAKKILNSLDLLSFANLHPMSLSGGQKQRVAIASAIASEKEIIIFDEPTSGLDFRHMKEVAYTLQQLAQTGKTIFVISHDLELILSCCTHVLHMEQGKVVKSYSLDTNGSEKIKTFFLSAMVRIKCAKEIDNCNIGAFSNNIIAVE